MVKQKPGPATLDDVIAKMGLTVYRLTIIDETIDRLGREINSIRLEPSNIVVNPKTNRSRIRPEALRRINEISFESEILFQSLVVNLYSFYEILDQLPDDNVIVNKINESMSPCLRGLKNKRDVISKWRNWIAAHGKLWGTELLGPLDITHRPQKFQKTVYLLTKYACMYGYVITDNLISNRVRGNRKLHAKWKSDEVLETKDYFQQLKRSKQVKKIVKENLKKKKGLVVKPRFVRSEIN